MVDAPANKVRGHRHDLTPSGAQGAGTRGAVLHPGSSACASTARAKLRDPAQQHPASAPETDNSPPMLLVARRGRTARNPQRVIGLGGGTASVYSASAYASKELPELDVSPRGAVSIARRLQDPLAELVKYRPPRASGSGSTSTTSAEHPALSRSLDAVVEDCVNAVGVEGEHRLPRRCCRGSPGLGEGVARANRCASRRGPGRSAPASSS